MRRDKIEHYEPQARHIGPGQGVRLDVNILPEREEPEKQKQTQPQQEPAKISILINSVYYFLDTVFILKSPEITGYTLLVIHEGKALTVKNYKTVRDARIAFSIIYGHKAYEKEVKAQWSVFYPPEHDWLNEKLNAEPIENKKEKEKEKKKRK